MVSLKRESIKIEQYMAVRMREVQARLGVRVPMALSLSQSCAGTGLKHSHTETGLKSDPVLQTTSK